MKLLAGIIKALFLASLFLLCLTLLASAQSFKVAQVGSGLREYLPGDIVHLVIESPPDTNRVKAVMPDGKEIELNYDGQSNVWNGYWEVPAGTKKGIYRSGLIATDVQGSSFQGSSADFYIGEPVLALMMRIYPTEETRTEELTEQERTAKQRAIESARLAKAAGQPAAQFEAAVQPPVTRPVIKARAKAPVRVAAKKQRTRVAARKARPRRVARAIPKEDINVTKARLVVAARSYLNQAKYMRAKNELKALLKIEPNSREIKAMVNRLEAVIRAKGDRL